MPSLGSTQTQQTEASSFIAATQSEVDSKGATKSHVIIENSFGTLKFDRTKSIQIPNGLVGLANFQEFGLTHINKEQFKQFKLLQCLTNAEISLILLPIEQENSFIEQDDIKNVLKTLEIKESNASIFLITTIRKTSDGTDITVNLKAPLFLDTQKQIAQQYVLSNKDYSLRKSLLG